jgi:hypothetical protein
MNNTIERVTLGLASFLAVAVITEVAAANGDRGSGSRDRFSFEIHQGADPVAESEMYPWENLPGHDAVRIKLAANAALDSSILRSVKAVRIEKGRYAGYYDVNIFFTDSGGDAFESLLRASVGKRLGYVFCGTAVAVHDILPGGGPDKFHWRSYRLNSVLTEAKAQHYVTAVNDEIAQRQGASNQSLQPPAGR